MAAALLCGLYRATFSLKCQDFRDPKQNSDPTDQWGIAFSLSKAVLLWSFKSNYLYDPCGPFAIVNAVLSRFSET